MTGRTLGSIVAPLLKAFGVDIVFGIPGVHNLELYRGLPESGIRHVLAHHEQGAGFMADGYARMSGRPGVCFVISGPGLTNIMTPLGQADSDSVPLVVISAVVPEAVRGTGQLHDMRDQAAAAGTVTQWSVTARSAKDLASHLRRALAPSPGRRRPVHIQIPTDVLASPAGSFPEVTASGVPSVEWDLSAVERAADLIRNAAGPPAVIAGGGAREATAELARLVDATNATVVTTVAGKGVFPPDDPRCVGSRLPQPVVQKLIEAAPVVIGIGTELAYTDIWRDRLELSGTLVRIDVDERQLESADIAIRAPASRALDALTTALTGHVAAPAHDLSAVVLEADAAARATHDDASPVIDAIRAALPADCVVVTDMTEMAYLGNEVFEVPAPGQWLHPVGFGTLGYAIPAGVGASLATNAPVAVIVGDYGIHFTAAELGTAADLGLAVPVLVWNNDGLGAIDRAMRQCGIEPPAGHPARDLRALATAYSSAYERLSALNELDRAVESALRANAPTLIDISAETG